MTKSIFDDSDYNVLNGTTYSETTSDSIIDIDKLAETFRNLKKEFRGPASWNEPWIVSRADYERLKKLLPEKDTLPILFPHRFGGFDIVVEEEYHGPPIPLSEWRNRK